MGEVALGQAQLDAAIATRDEAVADAEPGDVERVRREQDLLVLAAQNHLTAAKAALDELSGPVAHWLHASVRRSPFVFVL